MDTIDARIAAVAASQFGLVTRRQARKVGMKDAAIARRVASGGWELVLPTVFRIAAAPVTAEQGVLAATLWAGPGSVASHPTASEVLKLPDTRSAQPHVSVLRKRAPSTNGVVVHRTLALDDIDRRRVGPIWCTSAARTIIDRAPNLDEEALTAMVEHARRTGLTTLGQIRRRLDQLGTRGRPGSRALTQLLDSYQPGDRALESRLEVRMARLLSGSAVPRALRQHWVSIGGKRFRLDFAWPSAMLAVECEGWYVHGSRLVWKHDRARQAQLAAAHWRVLPVTWDDVTQRAAETMALIEAAILVPGSDLVA